MRCIMGTYVSADSVHAMRDLEEQTYRINERKANDASRFAGACARIDGKRLTYSELIRRPEGAAPR
jgi:hypothetical protein